MKKLVVIILVICCTTIFAEYPSGVEILEKVDENLFSDNRIISAKMVVHSRRNSRTIELKSWSQGDTKAFSEYLSPARERGTKMLKLEDRLWIYTPSTDRTIQISGHMLRQSVMGSDLSYEDMMDDTKLSNSYDATVSGVEEIASRSCYVLELEATKPDIAYQSRIIWVDQERFVPMKEELYAKSGKLLKNTTLDNFKLIDNRWFPMRMVFKDVLKDGKGTEYIIDSIEFNAQISEHIFSKASLRR